MLTPSSDSPGQSFAIQPTITNAGGYIAAGVTVKVEGASSFGGDINTTKFLRNLMFQGDSVTPTISFTAPSVPQSYPLTIRVDGINREFASYPISIPITVDVIQGPPASPSPRFDFDGDRKTDIAIYRPGDRTWWILNSSNGTFRVQQWGLTGDKPVPGDYDGDGRADTAIFRPVNGTWWIINSSNGTIKVQQ
jgi:hypothetical protein